MNLRAACPTACRGRAWSRPGVVLQKDAIFQQTIAFRGPDLASSLDSELVSAIARLNNALRRLGSGWALFVEAQRFASSAYPRRDLAAPGRVGRRRERRSDLRGGRRALRVELLPDLRLGAAARPRGAAPRPSSTSDAALGAERRAHARSSASSTSFQKTVAELADILRAASSPRWALLDDDQTLSYLHSTVSTNRHPVRASRDADVPRRALAGHGVHAGRRADARRPLSPHLHRVGLSGVDAARDPRRSQPPARRVPLGDALPLPRQGRGQGAHREVPKAVVVQAQGPLDAAQGGGRRSRRRRSSTTPRPTRPPTPTRRSRSSATTSSPSAT